MLNINATRTAARFAIAAVCALSTQAFAAVASTETDGPAAKACPQLAQQLQKSLDKLAAEQSKTQQMQVSFKVTPDGVAAVKTQGAPSLIDGVTVRRAIRQLQCDTSAFAGQEFNIALNLRPTR